MANNLRIYNQNELKEFHRISLRNFVIIQATNGICGCFSCQNIIQNYTVVESCIELDNQRTAICPCCGIDSLLMETDTLEITESLLKQMNNKYFNYNLEEDNNVTV